MIVDGTPYFLELAVGDSAPLYLQGSPAKRRFGKFSGGTQHNVLTSCCDIHACLMLPVEAAHGFHAAIRNSKLVIYPDTGHLPQEEVADESSAEVRAFLAGHR